MAKKIELDESFFPSEEAVAQVSAEHRRPTTDSEAMDIILGVDSQGETPKASEPDSIPSKPLKRTKKDSHPRKTPIASVKGGMRAIASTKPRNSKDLSPLPKPSVSPQNYFVQAPNQTRSYQLDLVKGQVLYEYLLDQTALDYLWRRRWRQIAKSELLSACQISENSYRTYRQYLESRKLIYCGKRPGRWHKLYWLVFFPEEETTYDAVVKALTERNVFQSYRCEALLDDILAQNFADHPTASKTPITPNTPQKASSEDITPQESLSGYKDLAHKRTQEATPLEESIQNRRSKEQLIYEDDDERQIANTHLKYSNNAAYGRTEQNHYHQLKGAIAALNTGKWDAAKCLTLMNRIGERTKEGKGINSFAFWLTAIVNELQKKPTLPSKRRHRLSRKQLEAETDQLIGRHQHLYVGMRQEEYQTAWQRKFAEVAWSYGIDPDELTEPLGQPAQDESS